MRPLARVVLHHLASPGCDDAYGYAPALDRIRLVYGDQVEIRTSIVSLYDDRASFLRHAGIATDERLSSHLRDSAARYQLPVRAAWRATDFARTNRPAALAAVAAEKQGAWALRRFLQAYWIRAFVDVGRDSRDGGVAEAVAEARLDAERLERDLKEEDAIVAEINACYDALPDRVNMATLAVEGPDGHVEYLHDAFQPLDIENAIDALASFKKNAPNDVAAYLHDAGPSSLIAIARVFMLAPSEANTRLQALEKARRVTAVRVGEHTFWRSVPA